MGVQLKIIQLIHTCFTCSDFSLGDKYEFASDARVELIEHSPDCPRAERIVLRILRKLRKICLIDRIIV